MPELRYDIIRQRWVSVANIQALKPNDFPLARKKLEATTSLFCPFCEGNETYTPPEIIASREYGEPDTPGWQVRVVPNKYAAFGWQGEFAEWSQGLYNACSSQGSHEVVVETPEHEYEFHQYNQSRIAMLIDILQERYRSLAQDPCIHYVQIYKNRGVIAGASLEHSHSQIMALPIEPAENQGLKNYYQKHQRCLICDILTQEQSGERPRIIYESEHFLIMCPYAPRFPYESWIVPRRHVEHFGDMNLTEAEDLTALLYYYSDVIVKGLSNPAYNFVVNTAPVNSGPTPAYHWYLEILPRLIIESGVEVVSGIHMNPVSPELAAPILREAMSEAIMQKGEA